MSDFAFIALSVTGINVVCFWLGLKSFKLKIINKETYAYFEKASVTHQSVIQCHRWFSGWKDLDIIWDYILSETYFGSISSCRDKYAIARGTDEYGNKKVDHE